MPIMEAALHARDRVGVQDFVLLEDFTNIDAFLDNLKKRFSENLIYVSHCAYYKRSFIGRMSKKKKKEIIMDFFLARIKF